MNTAQFPTLSTILGLPIFDITFWGIQTAAMILTALLIPNLKITSIFGPILAVAGLSVINVTIWSSELFATIPNSLTTQTAALLAINGGIFWILVKILPGIESKGLLPVIIAPLVFTACSTILPQVITQVNWTRVAREATNLLGEAKHFVTPQSNNPTTNKS